MCASAGLIVARSSGAGQAGPWLAPIMGGPYITKDARVTLLFGLVDVRRGAMRNLGPPFRRPIARLASGRLWSMRRRAGGLCYNRESAYGVGSAAFRTGSLLLLRPLLIVLCERRSGDTEETCDVSEAVEGRVHRHHLGSGEETGGEAGN